MEVRVSDAIETLLAPALLPRGGFNHQLLLWLRELELRFPLLGAGAPPRDETPGVSDAATEREGAPVQNYGISVRRRRRARGASQQVRDVRVRQARTVGAVSDGTGRRGTSREQNEPSAGREA